MLLYNKNAVIFGAAGSLGSAFAWAFANEGATLFLSGRNLAPVQKLADAIVANGGKASAAKVDATNEVEVRDYLKTIKRSQQIDIGFNAINYDDKQDRPLIEMPLEDFYTPIKISMRSQFICCCSLGKIMAEQKSGVILTLTATPGGIAYPNTGGFGAACSAVEAFSKQLASELGIYNVRVVTIRSAGSPDSKVFKQAIAASGSEKPEFLKRIEADTMLKAMPMMQDIANAAVFAASDRASMITGTTIDVSVGSTTAINHIVRSVPFVNG